MKASPLLISWHNENAPIYSAHFEPHGKDRLATAGGDNNIRLWKVELEGDERKVTYLTTLIKVCPVKYYTICSWSNVSTSQHTQAVNVVRFAPKGIPASTVQPSSAADIWQGRCWLLLETMGTYSYGCPQRPTTTAKLLVRIALRTKRHGESNICAVHLVPKYTILLGPQTGCFSLPAAWITSHVSTMRRPVRFQSSFSTSESY